MRDFSGLAQILIPQDEVRLFNSFMNYSKNTPAVYIYGNQIPMYMSYILTLLYIDYIFICNLCLGLGQNESENSLV